MKYTVEGFNQEELVRLGLDHADALILRWFVTFQGSGKMTEKQVDGQTFQWVKYKAIIEDLPCLGIGSTKSIGRRMDKLVMTDVLVRYVSKDQTGSYTWFRMGEAYIGLVEAHSPQKSDPLPSKVPCALPPKVQPKDSSSKEDPSTTSTAFPKPPSWYEAQPYGKDFLDWWRGWFKKDDGKKNTLRVYQACRRKGGSREQLLEARERYRVKVRGKANNFIKGAAVFLGPGDHWLEILEGDPPVPEQEEDWETKDLVN